MSCTEITLQCVGINAEMALHFFKMILIWLYSRLCFILSIQRQQCSHFFTLKIKSQTTDSVLPVAKSATVAYTNAILKK